MATRRKAPAKPARTRPRAATADESTRRRARQIQVMISGRNNDPIPSRAGGTVSLLKVRQDLWRRLDRELLCGQRILKVWINEEAGGPIGGGNVWQSCQAALERSHIIIVIYNGEAGWSFQHRGNGICHEEIKYAYEHFPYKLRLIDVSQACRTIPPAGPTHPQEAALNRKLAAFIAELQPWMLQAKDDESLIEQVLIAVADAVSELAITGSRGRKGRYYFGSPLDWSRLSYQERKDQIEQAVISVLESQYDWERAVRPSDEEDQAPCMVWAVQGGPLLMLVHGIPSSFGIAEARELVGRPYLLDHATLAAAQDSDLAGPVHLIACHKTCTESQIFSFMGHPDVYIVQAPFGFFAADLNSFAQTFFLTNCRDPGDTSTALKEMFDWISNANEEEPIVSRARSRQRILQAVRAEIEAHSPPRR